MKHTAAVAIRRLAFLHQAARRLAMNYHEIFELARIFHDSRDEKAAKADGARQTQDFYQGCMSPYCPDQNSSLTQQPSAFPAFAVERDEIFGLDPISEKSFDPHGDDLTDVNIH